MLKLIEEFLAWLDRRMPQVPFNSYEVTPRQGRYAVRRKLLRRLQHREPAASPDLFQNH